MNVREKFDRALSGESFEHPVYAVYDWFVKNRPAVDWEMLFDLGLGQINHANLIRHSHPNFKLVEKRSEENGLIRRDVNLITDKGDLHEWYLGEWRQEHFIKTPEDYRIMIRALEDVKVVADDKDFLKSETKLGERGITVGQIAGLGAGRTPLMVLQIDWVGLEQFSIDLAYELPELFELLDMMNVIKLEEIRQAVKAPASQIKLWENLSIDTLGPVQYRRHMIPLYKQIIEIISNAGKRLQVHYDGRLKTISEDIASLDLDGIDSFTESPEGDMSVCEARKIWPDKFIWQNVNLNWYELPFDKLKGNLIRSIEAAGHKRHCLMISEEVPQNWRNTVPLTLQTIKGK